MAVDPSSPRSIIPLAHHADHLWWGPPQDKLHGSQKQRGAAVVSGVSTPQRCINKLFSAPELVFQ